ncbi:uncharacterized protein LOC115764193 [Drosophila novamexicana]|uniref:uncharacterized protein LOC115764193 n=1 Tax=Drosophila novamexicana TaxID=47314 RepID=UPI0011E5DD34|nr:uncharacterized protein LOC115764193 [Drosophila novamexicana]
MCRPLCALCLLVCLASAQPGQDSCSQDSGTLLCRGERAVRNVLRNLSKSDQPLVIMRGLELVPVPNNEVETPPTAAADMDATLLDSVSAYLRTHELNLKLGDLLDEPSGGGQVAEARKKDKGQGLLLAMALMFGKMMAVLGLGGIGALAMKALGVAMVALMMAGMLGLKSAAQQGQESSHSISYVTGEGHHHKRRRREAGNTLAYRAWQR